MCRSNLMKRMWVTWHSVDWPLFFIILADKIHNFKHINMELQTYKLSKVGFKWKVCIHPLYQLQVVSSNDDLIIALTRLRKWATQSALTVLANRVGNFKSMNMELNTSTLSKVGFKWKVCIPSTNFRWS
jgi:hypothetical protein